MTSFRRWLRGRSLRADRTDTRTPSEPVVIKPESQGPSTSPVQNVVQNHDLSLEWTASPKHNEHRISFLDLPRELRDRTYDYCLIMEQPFDIGNSHLKPESRRDWTFANWNRYPKAATLLATCKQIHAEAAPVLYGQNAFETSLSINSAAANDLIYMGSLKRGEDPSEAVTRLPFHPTYCPLVGSRSFRFGSIWRQDAGLNFLIPMMYRFKNVDGAFFRHQGQRGPSRWVLRNDVFVAGWRRKGFDDPLRPHNKIDCGDSIEHSYVASSDDVLDAAATMSEPSHARTWAPAIIKGLYYDAHVHGCLLQGDVTEFQDNQSIKELLRSTRVLKLIYVFTPHVAED